MSFLTVREGGGQRVFRLPEVTVIGRGPSCDVVVSDPMASKRHAEIRETNGRYLLTDLESTNGTLLSGQKIEMEVSLQDGEEISIGDATLLFTRVAPAVLDESSLQPEVPDRKNTTKTATAPRPSGLLAKTDVPSNTVPHGTVFVPVERFGLRAADFAATTIRAMPSSASEFGIWLRSLYSLLREANNCESEDDLLATATRILSEALPGGRVRVLFETKGEEALKGDSTASTASDFIAWSPPVKRNQETRILDAKLTASRTRLIAYARERCVAVLSRDVEADERASTHRIRKKTEEPKTGITADEREHVSLLVSPLVSGRSVLGFLSVERIYKPFHVGKKVSGPFTEAHLEFVAAAAYPLGTLLGNLRRRQTVLNENERLRKSVADRYQMVGKSKLIMTVLSVIERVAQTDSSVLVSGESGTGKELVARSIHTLSRRRNGPFEAINCGALPENLVESELFGHARGAFTGAVANRMGCFEAASRGTLFLDEIGELPLSAQTKLLRVLEESKIARVGESRLRDIDCRIIAATNRNLTDEVKAGRFRADLYYRLRVMDILLPPLRDRLDDLSLLCEHLLAPFGTYRIHPEVLELFKAYRWPGNIRELRNTLERMAVMARPHPGEAARAAVTQLTGADVPLDIRRAVELGPLLVEPVGAEAPDTPAAANPKPKPKLEGAFSIDSEQIRSLEQLQVDYARWVLEQFNGNKTKAAKALGIQRSTLYSWTEWDKNEKS
jgi:transcriptional regulator with GAF, ATPase, and Fis domain